MKNLSFFAAKENDVIHATNLGGSLEKDGGIFNHKGKPTDFLKTVIQHYISTDPLQIRLSISEIQYWSKGVPFCIDIDGVPYDDQKMMHHQNMFQYCQVLHQIFATFFPNVTPRIFLACRICPKTNKPAFHIVTNLILDKETTLTLVSIIQNTLHLPKLKALAEWYPIDENIYKGKTVNLRQLFCPKFQRCNHKTDCGKCDSKPCKNPVDNTGKCPICFDTNQFLVHKIYKPMPEIKPGQKYSDWSSQTCHSSTPNDMLKHMLNFTLYHVPGKIKVTMNIDVHKYLLKKGEAFSLPSNGTRKRKIISSSVLSNKKIRKEITKETALNNIVSILEVELKRPRNSPKFLLENATEKDGYLFINFAKGCYCPVHDRMHKSNNAYISIKIDSGKMHYMNIKCHNTSPPKNLKQIPIHTQFISPFL